MSQTLSVFTNNYHLINVNALARLDATGHCWIATLSTYNFIITYKQGKSKTDVHGLSRVLEIIGCDTVKAIKKLNNAVSIHSVLTSDSCILRPVAAYGC